MVRYGTENSMRLERSFLYCAATWNSQYAHSLTLTTMVHLVPSRRWPLHVPKSLACPSRTMHCGCGAESEKERLSSRAGSTRALRMATSAPTVICQWVL